MLRLIAGRLVQMAATLLVVSALIWLVMGLMPGDPADLAMMADPALTAADIARLRAAHGLDQPLHERYLAWLAAVLRGEFGFSRLYAVPAERVLWPALGSTLVLFGGVAAAGGGHRHRARRAGGGAAALGAGGGRARGAGAVGADFWLGILLIILFAVTLGWLPAGGTADAPGIAEALRHLVLPVATLAFANLAAYARHAMAAMQAALREPYIRTARMKGLPERAVVWRHAFPNAAVPVLTVAGAGRRRAGLRRADRRDDLRPPRHGQADLRRGHGQRLQPRAAGAAAGLRRDHAGDPGRRRRRSG